MKVSSIAHWCTQTHQCCRAYTRTHSRLSCIHAHTLSLYLFIINNNFPADMKVIRAVSWIHWACSTSRYSKKIIPVLQWIISKAAQSVQRLEDWRYNAHAKQQTLLHFALYGRFSSPPFCLPNGCLLKIALTNGYFLRPGPARSTNFDYWRIVGTLTLTVSYIYLVFTDSTAIVGKKGRFQNVNPRQPQKAGNPKPQNPKP